MAMALFVGIDVGHIILSLIVVFLIVVYSANRGTLKDTYNALSTKTGEIINLNTRIHSMEEGFDKRFGNMRNGYKATITELRRIISRLEEENKRVTFQRDTMRSDRNKLIDEDRARRGLPPIRNALQQGGIVGNRNNLGHLLKQLAQSLPNCGRPTCPIHGNGAPEFERVVQTGRIDRMKKQAVEKMMPDILDSIALAFGGKANIEVINLDDCDDEVPDDCDDTYCPIHGNGGLQRQLESEKIKLEQEIRQNLGFTPNELAEALWNTWPECDSPLDRQNSATRRAIEEHAGKLGRWIIGRMVDGDGTFGRQRRMIEQLSGELEKARAKNNDKTVDAEAQKT